MSEAAAGGEASPATTNPVYAEDAVGVIVLGMAGSGKTTVVQRLTAYLREVKKKHFVINLDPAVKTLLYKPDLDIRDSVKYKDLMKTHGWGPNGAIVACLNLFAAQEDDFIPSIENNRDPGELIVVDTPGQIEVFTISASGEVLTGIMSGMMPTVGLYVIDAPRSSDPVTFTSNMLYACSVLFRLRIPLILVINKIDVTPPTQIQSWLSDTIELEEAFEARRKNPDSPECFQAIVAQDIGDVLSEFFELLPSVPFSAVTGIGCAELLETLEKQAKIAIKDHQEELEELKKGKKEADAMRIKKNMGKFRADKSGEGIVKFEEDEEYDENVQVEIEPFYDDPDNEEEEGDKK